MAWAAALLWALAFGGAIAFGSKAMVADTPTTPGGMFALEFPGNRSGVQAALALLDAAPTLGADAIGRDEVRRALYWDFGFIGCYTLMGCLGMAVVVRRRFAGEPPDETGESAPSWLVAQAAVIAPIVAGAFDVIENAALLTILDTHVCGPCENAGLLGSITTLAALAKWALCAFVAAYLLYSLSIVTWRWIRAVPPGQPGAR